MNQERENGRFDKLVFLVFFTFAAWIIVMLLQRLDSTRDPFLIEAEGFLQIASIVLIGCILSRTLARRFRRYALAGASKMNPRSMEHTVPESTIQAAIIAKALDPKLHIVIVVGALALGWLFHQCWNYARENFYPTYGRPFCSDFADMLVLGALPFKWLVAVSICVVLLSVYRLWSIR